jgi:hypothetical protein
LHCLGHLMLYWSPNIIENNTLLSVDQGKHTYYSSNLTPDLLRVTSIVDRTTMAPAAAA